MLDNTPWPAQPPAVVTPIYVSQWGDDHNLPTHLPPLHALDNTPWPPQKITPAAAITYVSQWLGQSDTARLPPNRRIDDLAAPIGYGTEFLPNDIAQWLGQSDTPHLSPPKPSDARFVAWTPTGSTILVTPAQWLGQSDIKRLAPIRPLDDARNPSAPVAAPSISFVSQWLGQSDVSRLRLPQPPDSASLSIAPPPPPTPTPSVFWMEESGLGRWTLLRPPTMWDQSASYVEPVTPPVPPIVTMTCIYSLTPNFTAPQMGRGTSRYARIGDTLTWAVSFYVNRSIVLTPIAATVVVSYQTNAGPATFTAPLSATGYRRFAEWTVPVGAIEVSIATWAIFEGANVAARGAINIFNRFARPLLN